MPTISDEEARDEAKERALSSIERNGPNSVYARFLNKAFDLGLDLPDLSHRTTVN